MGHGSPRPAAPAVRGAVAAGPRPRRHPPHSRAQAFLGPPDAGDIGVGHVGPQSPALSAEPRSIPPSEEDERMTFHDDDLRKRVDQLTLEQKVRLFTGADFWSL